VALTPAVWEGRTRIAREVPYRILAPSSRSPRDGWPAVIALHGYGWDETRFTPVVRRRFGAVPWVWIVPRGPWRVHPTRGEVGYSWLVGSGEHPDHAGMRGTEALLRQAIAGTARRLRLDRRKVALLGFSQGGFAAGVAALHRPRTWRGAAVLGAYINPAMVPDGLGRARGARLAFFHGRQDREVPLERARRSVRVLAEAGIPAALKTFPGGHTLSPAMADAARSFLLEILG
jgi:predicted esterase